MADIYSTNDAGKMLGINPNTIKTWKNRTFVERLLEGTHWVTQQNQIFWTESGLAELKAIAESTSESAPDSTVNQEPIQPESATDSIKTMLQPLAKGIAAQALLMDLGLKPCNPAALIAGNFPTSLPESNQ